MKTRILLVDDDPKVLDAEETYFDASDDYVVVGKASDGAEAVDLFRAFEPDAMVLDMLMPERDGLSVLEEIGKTDCVVVAVGEVGGESLAGLAMSAGADYYMVKPFAPTELDKHLKLLKRNRPMVGTYTRPLNFGALDKKITDVFITVGIPAHIRGYQFLREAVKLAVDNPDVINSITKQLYPEVADRFGTSASKVERAIRHAIEVAWNKGRIDSINSMFGVRVYSPNEKPTNGEFIALVADKMLLENF